MTTPTTPLTEADRILCGDLEAVAQDFRNGGQALIPGLMEQAAARIRALAAQVAELERERDRLLAELEEASPMSKCDCCGNPFRWHQMVPEEGDRWECLPCWEKENARERALKERSTHG